MPKRWRALGVLLVLAVILTPAVWGVWRERWSGGSAKDTVGIIDISGTISLVGEGPLEGAGSAKDALQYLNAARESPSIGAVVVRINSGGGSAAASQELHRSILSVRGAGKPVVISMAEAAASGGYYIAVAGDRILANPSTVTGSIGVIAVISTTRASQTNTAFLWKRSRQAPTRIRAIRPAR